jgi:Icc-related predicted phosphoesterase
MRLLAFSDIHHNLGAVRKLRASETNSFDAVVVAGDIGSESADEFFKILSTFKCPVLYVFGNWDHELSYSKVYADNCHLIHSNVVTIGELHFAGFSGCPTNWGKNPIARRILTKAKKTDSTQLRFAKNSILKSNRARLRKVIGSASVDPRKCVVITHERLSRLSEEIPGTLLHLFGHIHRYSDNIYKGTRYIDVAALDRPIPVRPRAKKRWTMEDCGNVNAGNYVTIEISSSQGVCAECVYMRREYPDWVPLEDSRVLAADWISEEKSWANPTKMLTATSVARDSAGP